MQSSCMHVRSCPTHTQLSVPSRLMCSIVTHYQEDSEQVMGLLLIIPHRVAETSLDMEEYLRTLE